MAVSTQEREMVLTTECGDPDVIYGNRLADLPQLNSDRGVVMGRFVGDFKDQAVSNQTFKPFCQTHTNLRKCNPVTIFTNDRHW